MIETAKTTFSMSYANLCGPGGAELSDVDALETASCRRKDAVEKRGPKKVRPLNLAELKKKVRDLDHGRKRSRGTGRLHGAYAESISRRDLNELVRQVRSDSNDPCQVDWLRTDLAWAMDGLEYRDCHVQNVQDLCSRYKFAPLTSAAEPCGEEIAGHLSRHFRKVWTAAVHQAGQRRQPEPHFSQRGAGRTYGHPHQQPILYAQLQRGHRALSGGV
jgi:hypothetical protein